jgi:FkbM family methyltransferase
VKDYSQYEQQLKLVKHFGDRKGFLIDVGANDGIQFSNSRALLELGWKGILIEPNPKAFKKLAENTLGCVNAVPIKTALADENRIAKLWVPPEEEDPLGTQSTLIKTYGWTSYDTVVSRFNCLFPFPIDLLLVDAEGADYQILLGVDFKVSKPEVVVVEGVRKGNFHNSRLIEELMFRNGYKPFLHEDSFTGFAPYEEDNSIIMGTSLVGIDMWFIRNAV